MVITSAFLLSNAKYINFNTFRNNITMLFLYQFFPAMMTLSTLHMYNIFNPSYGVCKLILDIHSLRKTPLKMKNKVKIVFIGIISTSGTIWILELYLGYVQEVFEAGNITCIFIDFGENVKSQGLTATILAVTEFIVFLFSLWVFTTFNATFIAFVCIIIGNEFEGCINDFDDKIPVLQDSELFFEVKQRYQQLVQLVFKVESHFRLFIGVSLTTSVILNCVGVFVLVTNQKCHDHSFTLQWVAPMTLVFVNILLLTIPVASLHSKAHAIVDPLIKWKTQHVENNLLLQVNLFLQQLSHTPVGLTVGGIATITKDSVLTIFGTILAYLIIVIQFGQDSEAECVSYNSMTALHQNMTNMTSLLSN